jgi:hypothetical protein
LSRVRVRVEEVQVADDHADAFEDEGLKHETTHRYRWPGKGDAAAVSHYRPASGGRLAPAGVTYFSRCYRCHWGLP